jgi:hypothetical protein
MPSWSITLLFDAPRRGRCLPQGTKDAKVMSRHFCLASGMAALCLMSASPFADASTKAPTPGLAAPIGPTAAARDITRRLLGLLSNLGSTAEVTPEHIGKAQGVSLNRKGEEGETMYLSTDVGSGWNFGVSQSPPQKIFKAGLRFWFYNPDPAADPGPLAPSTSRVFGQHCVRTATLSR